MLIKKLLLLMVLGGVEIYAQDPAGPPLPPNGTPLAEGRQIFLTRCATCHGTTGNGGEFAPGITARIPLRQDEDLVRVLSNGLRSSGMPAFPDIVGAQRTNLIAWLRGLAAWGGSQVKHLSVQIEGGGVLSGSAINSSSTSMQLLGDDKKIHLLRNATSGRFRAVTSQEDWPSYNGDTVGYRYSKMSQITPANAGRLTPVWINTVPNTRELESTPVVVDGVMYVTSANEVYAFDAGNGRAIWHYQRARTQGIGGVAALGVNRGVAVAGDDLFFATDNAHLISLNRHTGALGWEVEMADWHKNYYATAAPLVVNDLVISGISGGDEGVRGFLAAYDQHTGKEVWRVWTVPAAGEPGSETWGSAASLEHGAGGTWMTGSYDRETDTLIWPVGNPGPDLIGDNRPGDNLYTNSVLALDPKTGKKKWHFQFTPHDVHDFDAMAPSALIDTDWEGKQRKLLVQANRNGFFYVLDRVNGKFLFGTPFTKVTWASGLDGNGRPIVAPNMEPTHEGNLICPWLNGASNWYSSSWNPLTKLYYVQTNDACGVFTRIDMPFQEGRGYMGGSFGADPANPAKRILRAIDIRTGKAVWQIEQTGDSTSWGGVLSTAGGVMFFSADDGSFSVVDARTGKLLYAFETNQFPHASPMTYMFDHKQYVAVAAGRDVIAFALEK